MRMQGKHADDVVRIGVVPAAVSSRIVDGQQLDDLHARGNSPVDEATQVAEIAHAVGMLAAQRKHGNGHTGSPPRLFGQPQVTAVEHQHLAIGNLVAGECLLTVGYRLLTDSQRPVAHRDGAVVAFLPGHEFMGLTVYHHIFIFYRQQPPLRIDAQHPFAVAGILHRQVTAGVPRADGRMRTADGYLLTGRQLGSRHAEDDGTAKDGQRQHAERFTFNVQRKTLCDAIGRRIEMHGQRTVAPPVGKHIVVRGIKVVDAGHHVPLAAQHLSVGILHLIAVTDVRQLPLTAQECCRLERPQVAVVGLHQQILMAHAAVSTMEVNADMEAFAPCRMIVYREFQFHLFSIVSAKLRNNYQLSIVNYQLFCTFVAEIKKKG